MFTPKSRKLNLIKCLSFRALNICSDSKIKDELRVIKELFLNNGYPEEVINDNINLTSVHLNVQFILAFLGLVLLASHLLIKLPLWCLIVLMLSKLDLFSLPKRHLTPYIRMYFLSLIKVY